MARETVTAVCPRCGARLDVGSATRVQCASCDTVFEISATPSAVAVGQFRAGWYADPAGGPGQRYWDGALWHDAVPARAGVPTKPKRGLSTRALIVAGVVVVGIVVVGNVVESNKADNKAAKSAASSSATPTLTTTTQRAVKPPPSPSVSAEQLDPAAYQQVTDREFAYILKDPYAHYGDRIVIYGKVLQFDTLTGDSVFRADVVAVPGGSNEPENAFVEATDPAILADVVEGDSVVMFVEVAGTETYETQLGAERTVPLFDAYIVRHWKRSG